LTNGRRQNPKQMTTMERSKGQEFMEVASLNTNNRKTTTSANNYTTYLEHKA
jgi:hypothetical protein